MKDPVGVIRAYRLVRQAVAAQLALAGGGAADDPEGRAAGDAVVRNPHGPADSFDPSEPGIAKRVQKGGSFLCTDQYCGRYRPGGRGKGAPDSAANHVGFRTVKSQAAS